MRQIDGECIPHETEFEGKRFQFKKWTGDGINTVMVHRLTETGDDMIMLVGSDKEIMGQLIILATKILNE